MPFRRHPDITVTDLGNMLKKTPSACSQTVRRLRDKGWVEQQRDPENNRRWHLRLTDQGKKVHTLHQELNEDIRKLMSQLLSNYSLGELELYRQIEEQIYDIYRKDLERNKTSS